MSDVADQRLRTEYTFEEPVEKEFILLEPGEYPFEVKEVFAFEQTKNSNDKLPLDLLVGNPDEEQVVIGEDLIFTVKARWKIDAFVKSIHGGNIRAGTPITFDKSLEKRRGLCIVGVEEFTFTRGEKKGQKGSANRILGYTWPGKGETAAGPAPAAGTAPPDDGEDVDDVPF